MKPPAFAPITITFERVLDHTLKAVVDDGESTEPYWLTVSEDLLTTYPELAAVYRRMAAVGALRNWSTRRQP